MPLQNLPFGNPVPTFGRGGPATPGVPSTLTAGPVYGYSPSAGGIPSVPNPSATQGSAVGGNQANLPGISALSTGTGTLNAKLGALPYQLNLPNYGSLLGSASSNALSNLHGVLPSDVTQQITQAAAERGVGIGAPSSPNANAGLLRGLGLTSLGLQQQGLQQFGSLMGMTPTGPQFNPASMYVSPDSFQQAQAAANLYGAAPIPAYAQQANLSALQSGVGAGRGATGPQQPAGPQTQSADLVNQILQRYAPTATGAPASGGRSSPDAQNDAFYSNLSDQDQMAYEDYLYGTPDTGGGDQYSADYGGEM